MCVCLTIKILFNIAEVARLWAVDERVSMLCPILWHNSDSVDENACLCRGFSQPNCHSEEHPDVALWCHASEMFAYLFQSFPRGLFHVNSGPQHVVEGCQEVMTDVKGELLNGLHLSDGILVTFEWEVGKATVKLKF